MPQNLKTLIALFATCLLSGCVGLGPRLVKSEQNLYNDSVAVNGKEEILLNLVRIRYSDTPQFLRLTNITSSHSLSFSGSGSAGWSLASLGGASASASGSSSYQTSPTFSYSPLYGQEYVNELLRPVPVSFIVNLIHLGWDNELIYKLCLQRINHIRNAPGADSPIALAEPEYEQFFKLTENLSILHKRAHNQIVRKADEAGNIYYEFEFIRLDKADPDSIDKLNEVKEMLGLDEIGHSYVIVSEPTDDLSKAIAFHSRSLMSILFFLSRAVDVPYEHKASGKVFVTRTEENAEFDWDAVNGDLLKVCHSKNKPTEAYAAVRYKGYWFYVSDHDPKSKVTFMLLTHLANMQSGDYSAPAPVITIPVGMRMQ